ncbi:MAG TPA: DoxX family protein [Opitutus sp.]|nr:DoxX family protein [Opitutus sp.]
MTSNPVVVSTKAVWTGRVLTALPFLALVLSAVMKLTNAPGVAAGMQHFGIPANLTVGLGILELACALLYVIPRTAVIGAILVTGYLGGAILTALRVGDSVYVQAILGILAWGGLYLRDPRIRALIPLKS